MKYISTRGGVAPKSFEEVILTGLAPDGGLFVPDQLPQFSHSEISSWKNLSYQELALQVMSPFVDDEIPQSDLKQLIEKSYSTFRHSEIAPLVKTGENEWILELFMGQHWRLKILHYSFWATYLTTL